MKRIKFKPHDYQQIALDFMAEHNKALLILDMGLGKTVTTLTHLRKMMKKGRIKRPLIIAPKIVSENTWATELAKWQHLRRVRYIEIDSKDTKKRLEQFDRVQDGTITILSESKVQWLVDMLDEVGSEREWTFDAIVIDEISMFKNPQSNRFKNLEKKVQKRCKYVIGLTGTPAPNDLGDLWAIMYLLDKGARLGRTKRIFNKLYCDEKKIKINSGGNQQYIKAYDVQEAMYNEILDAISDIALAMKAEDWLENYQKPTYHVEPVVLSENGARDYNAMKKDKIIEINSLGQDSNDERLRRRIDRLRARGTIKAQDKANALEARLKPQDGVVKVTSEHIFSVINALRQLASGAIYEQLDTTGLDEEEIAERYNEHMKNRKHIVVHDAKLEALENIIEREQDNVFVFVSYKHEAERIRKHFEGVRFLNTANAAEVLPLWNAGKIPVLVANPASTKFGLNMQDGGHTIVWYSMGYSFEAFTQSNARLARQGQKHEVNVYMLQSWLAPIKDDTPLEDIVQAQTIDSAIMDAIDEKRELNDGVYSYLGGHDDAFAGKDARAAAVGFAKSELEAALGQRVEIED